MSESFVTIIVPAADVEAARLSCSEIPGGTGMLTAQLTTDVNGAPPATHYASSGTMDDQIAARMWPSSADVSTEEWQTACARLGLRQVVEEV
jgi:hypothetical protein